MCANKIKCADCGKELPSLVGCWWRHYYEGVEIYCTKCARSHVGGPGFDFGLISCDVIMPRI